MKYWLLKTEPEEFSIDDLKTKKRESWTGVRNFIARNHLKAMAAGDLCFIYHTGKEKSIVGLGKVVSGVYPDKIQFDPTSEYFDSTSRIENPKWLARDIAFVKKYAKPLSLATVKQSP